MSRLFQDASCFDAIPPNPVLYLSLSLPFLPSCPHPIKFPHYFTNTCLDSPSLVPCSFLISPKPLFIRPSSLGDTQLHLSSRNTFKTMPHSEIVQRTRVSASNGYKIYHVRFPLQFVKHPAHLTVPLECQADTFI